MNSWWWSELATGDRRSQGLRFHWGPQESTEVHTGRRDPQMSTRFIGVAEVHSIQQTATKVNKGKSMHMFLFICMYRYTYIYIYIHAYNYIFIYSFLTDLLLLVFLKHCMADLGNIDFLSVFYRVCYSFDVFFVLMIYVYIYIYIYIYTCSAR